MRSVASRRRKKAAMQAVTATKATAWRVAPPAHECCTFTAASATPRGCIAPKKLPNTIHNFWLACGEFLAAPRDCGAHPRQLCGCTHIVTLACWPCYGGGGCGGSTCKLQFFSSASVTQTGTQTDELRCSFKHPHHRTTEAPPTSAAASRRCAPSGAATASPAGRIAAAPLHRRHSQGCN